MNNQIEPKLVGGVGEINFGKQYRQGNRIYDAESIAMCLLSQPVGNAGGNSYLYLVEDKSMNEPTAVAMRGRYNADGKVEQNIEISDRTVANAITTVQKDSMVAEPKKLFNIYPKNGQAGNIYDLNCCAPCLPGFGAGGGGKELKVLEGVKIRKLTPKECFRLMGFSDDDFYKAEAVCSNSQLYKQAGNSIVVDVLENIFENLYTYLYT